MNAEAKKKKRAYEKLYREKNKDRISEKYRDWYVKNGRNRSLLDLEKILEWQEANPEKVLIEKQVSCAIRRREIVRPSVCSKCGSGGDIHAHHYDYDHYLHFIWVCARCHKLIHKQKEEK